MTRFIQTIKDRSRILRSIRDWFFQRGFIEIDLPVSAGEIIPEEHIHPFQIAGRENSYLLPSPELHLKPMLATGIPALFSITRAFRQGECGQFHLPEFAMLEWYRRGVDYEQLITDCQDLVRHAVTAVRGEAVIERSGRRYDLSAPFHLITVSQAFMEFAGWDPLEVHDVDRFDLDMVEKVEPALAELGGVFLKDFPPWQASLAALSEDGRCARRVELYLAGVELANGFTELMDARLQARRLAEQGFPPEQLPVGFLKGLSHAPSQAAGMALGIDRLVMLICGAESVQQVVPVSPEWLC